MNKRGQIFILAAVIIAVVVISMANVANFAEIHEEPKSFYDFSYDVRKEAKGVVDYEIYSGFADGTNVSDFVSLVAANIRDRDSESNFMFIYGNNETLVIENYGADVASLTTSSGNQLLSGDLNIESSISYGGTSKKILSTDYVSLDTTGSRTTFTDTNYINVTILKNEFSFPVKEYQQVIFLTQKEDGDESYISV